MITYMRTSFILSLILISFYSYSRQGRQSFYSSSNTILQKVINNNSENTLKTKLSSITNDDPVNFQKKNRVRVKQSRDIKKSKNKSHHRTVRGVGDKRVAILLACASLILPLGWHNWYLSRRYQAILQVLLTVMVITLPISWIWQLVDLIRLIVKGRLPY